MLKSAFHAFLLIAVAALATAAKPVPLTPQERFDKLAGLTSFGQPELVELRAIIELTKEQEKDADGNKDGGKLDCTFCPDALTWYLSSNDFFDEFRFLVDHNADFGIKDADGMTLLQDVCKGGHLDIIKYLVDHGADVNLPNKEGLSAIHYAVMGGANPDLVLYLLENGGDPNRRTVRNETPLHFAAKYSTCEVLQILVERGASIKAINWTLVENLIEQRNRQDKLYYDSDESQITALKKALGLKTPESLEEDFEEEEEEKPHYEEIDDDDEEDDGGERYVEAESASDPKKKPSSSSQDSETRIADIDDIPFDLLPRDVNDAATVDGLTALHYAAQNGSLDIIKFLVEHGADISAQDYEQSRSVIHFAALNGDIECIKYLTENGADLLDKDANGATAFHYAVMANNLEAVKYFVTKKLDYTAKDYRGWTAMHYAANGGALDVMKYLISKDLNINALNDRRRTPLFFARQHHELREFMLSHGAK